MGSKDEPVLFSAWSTGHFGPFAYPYGLKRSIEQSWQLNDDEKNLDEYTGFIRIKLSYLFGADEKSLVIPKNYNALNELVFLNELTIELLSNIDNTIYFNPNGELLLTKKIFKEFMKYSIENSLPALNIYSNIRLYNIDATWSLMDSVGNQQLDIPDIEVIIPKNEYNLSDFDVFIRNITFYIMNNGPIIMNGDTMDGPGGIRWRGYTFKNGLCDPPRNTLRWFPTNKINIPVNLLPEKENINNKKPWWKFW